MLTSAAASTTQQLYPSTTPAASCLPQRAVQHATDAETHVAGSGGAVATSGAYANRFVFVAEPPTRQQPGIRPPADDHTERAAGAAALNQQIQALSLYQNTPGGGVVEPPPPPYPIVQTATGVASPPPPSYAVSIQNRQSPTQSQTGGDYRKSPSSGIYSGSASAGSPSPTSNVSSLVGSASGPTAASVTRAAPLPGWSARQAKTQPPIIMQSVKSTQVQKPVLQTAIAPTAPSSATAVASPRSNRNLSNNRLHHRRLRTPRPYNKSSNSRRNAKKQSRPVHVRRLSKPRCRPPRPPYPPPNHPATPVPCSSAPSTYHLTTQPAQHPTRRSTTTIPTTTIRRRIS
ncbi:Serine/threonine-protein kinase lats1 [Sarracenia purpurea var. burkii]